MGGPAARARRRIACTILALAASLQLTHLRASVVGSAVLAIPDRANATPSIAADGDVVVVAWSAATPSGTTDVYAAISHDEGHTFSAPARVNDVDGDARVTGEQPPRVTLERTSTGQPSITVVWTGKGDRGTALRFARSTDGGRTFTKAALVPGSDAPGNRGWEAASAGFVLWLDHRELAQDATMGAMHHAHAEEKPDGVAMAQKSKLFVSALDRSIEPTAITGGVCYCCKTALVSSGGAVYAAWRHVYPGNIRDIAFTMSRDGGRTFAPPVRVSEDKWVLEGCPDDGPAMAVDGDGRVHIVWPTLVTVSDEPTIALFYATSTAGRRFSLRQQIPTVGLPHHPQIASARDGSLLLAWDELAGGTRRVATAEGNIDGSGGLHVARKALDDGDVGYYPVVAATTHGSVVAWTSGRASSSVIRLLRTLEPNH